MFTCCLDLGLLQCHSSAVMDAPDYGSPVGTYVHNYYCMRKSHDADFSEPQGLSSLGVLHLDLSITLDVFGLRAFDGSKPLTRMLSANELRLLVPDMDIIPQGLHDILIDDLSASPTSRCCHVSHGDITYLRQHGRRSYFGP